MKCDLCGNRDAVVFVHQITRGSKTEFRLCSECAQEQGVRSLDGTVAASLSNLLNKLIERKPDIHSLHCPKCTSSLADVKKRMQVGCASCWEQFGDEFSQGAAHQGRLPLRISEQQEAKQRIHQLEKELDEAIAAENYENAALVRDRIKELQGSPDA
ncbi:UvrB/UvrC motif-containing protein [Treponema sp.]